MLWNKLKDAIIFSLKEDLLIVVKIYIYTLFENF